MAFSPKALLKRTTALATGDDVPALLADLEKLKANARKLETQKQSLIADRDRALLEQDQKILDAINAGDEAAQAEIEKTSIAKDKRIESLERAIDANNVRIMDAERSLHEATAVQRDKTIEKLTSKFLRLATRLQEIKEQETALYSETVDAGQEIAFAILGMGLRIPNDAALFQEQINDLLSAEIARLFPTDVNRKLAMPGANTAQYIGVPFKDRKTFLAEIEQRIEYVRRVVHDGPHPRKPAPAPEAPPVRMSAAQVEIPVVALNGEAVELPPGKTMTAAEALASMGNRHVDLSTLPVEE